jgi:hypothetical protein
MFGKRYSLHTYAEWGRGNKPLTPREPVTYGHPKVHPHFMRDFERAPITKSGHRRQTLLIAR